MNIRLRERTLRTLARTLSLEQWLRRFETEVFVLLVPEKRMRRLVRKLLLRDEYRAFAQLAYHHRRYGGNFSAHVALSQPPVAEWML